MGGIMLKNNAPILKALEPFIPTDYHDERAAAWTVAKWNNTPGRKAEQVAATFEYAANMLEKKTKAGA